MSKIKPVPTAEDYRHAVEYIKDFQDGFTDSFKDPDTEIYESIIGYTADGLIVRMIANTNDFSYELQRDGSWVWHIKPQEDGLVGDEWADMVQHLAEQFATLVKDASGEPIHHYYTKNPYADEEDIQQQARRLWISFGNGVAGLGTDILRAVNHGVLARHIETQEQVDELGQSLDNEYGSIVEYWEYGIEETHPEIVEEGEDDE